MRSRLLDIIINNLYSRKEIFLRELISNGSDALDKIRFLSLADDSQLGEGEARNLEMRITYSPENRTLTIRDRGVGMTKEDLANNLGTIAKSGTAAFSESAAAGGASEDVNLIGQFGVGFYSAYLAADRVKVVSKHNADPKQHIWDSTADGSFTIGEDPAGNTLQRGTEITLFLKEDATEYANEDQLRKLIRKYSEFITFPIYLETTKVEVVDVEEAEEAAPASASASASAAPAARGDDEDVVAAEDEAPTPTPSPKAKASPKKTETKTTKGWEVVNNQKAIWHRRAKDINASEYADFYKTITKNEKDEPFTWIHFSAEGDLEFRSILYVPGKAPGDLYDNYYARPSSLRLYVRKVLISDEFEELMPRYLNFIRGVVDSDDLPLNVSREQLQQSKILKLLGKKLVRKVLEMIRHLALEKKADADDGEGAAPVTANRTYAAFWAKYGKNIKLGVIEDGSNRSKLAKLLRYRSSAPVPENVTAANGTHWRSLDDYVADMKSGQKLIYYIAGESLEAVTSSPFMEQLRAKGLEVLYMTDPIDEYTVQNLPEYDGHRLQSITKEGFHLPADDEKTEKKREALYAEQLKPLTSYLKRVLGKKVEKVAISSRLASSPCVLVTSQYGYSANLERIMKAQAFADPSKGAFLASKKTLEINPRHPLIAAMAAKAAADPEAVNADTRDFANIIFDAALLNSGFTIDDAKDFSTRIFRILKSGLKIDSFDLLPEAVVPADPVEEEEDDDDDDVGEDEEDGGEDDGEDDGDAGSAPARTEL